MKQINSQVSFSGFWQEHGSYYSTTSPASKISFYSEGKSVSIVAEAFAFFEIFIDKKHYKKIRIDAKRKYRIVSDLENGKHLIEIILCSELYPGVWKFYQIFYEGNVFPVKEKRLKIEFIGDSYSVGYGVEALSVSSGSVEETTNTTKSFAFLLAEDLNADYRFSAFSGHGLIHNYENMDENWTIPQLILYQEPGRIKKTTLRNFEAWQPDLIVLFVGINDFQGNSGLKTTDAFVCAYMEFLTFLRRKFKQVRFLLLATEVYPNDLLIPAVQKIYENERTLGFSDLKIKILTFETNALHGHPNVSSQEEVKNILLPIVQDFLKE